MCFNRCSNCPKLVFAPTHTDFLCPVEANVYEIEFLSFKIRDMDSNKVIFEVEHDYNPAEYVYVRTVKYELPKEFLNFKTIGTT